MLRDLFHTPAKWDCLSKDKSGAKTFPSAVPWKPLCNVRVCFHGISHLKIRLYDCPIFYSCLLHYYGDSRPNIKPLFRPIRFMNTLQKGRSIQALHRIERDNDNILQKGNSSSCVEKCKKKQSDDDKNVGILTSLFLMTTSFPIFTFLSMIQFLQSKNVGSRSELGACSSNHNAK